MVRWKAVWPKQGHFSLYFADFFDRSAATACKNLLCLAKSSHFFVSDATTLTSCHKKIHILMLKLQKQGKMTAADKLT